MLQSPYFLYRVELSEELDKDDVIPLDGFEIASGCPFLLWNSVPDEQLLVAAETGELDSIDGIETQARRLLADDRAARPVADFHRQWLHLDRYDDLSKDEDLYPGFDPSISSDMKAETQALIRNVIFEWNGSHGRPVHGEPLVHQRRPREIYGMDPIYGDELVEVELPANRSVCSPRPGSSRPTPTGTRPRRSTAGCSSSGRSCASTSPIHPASSTSARSPGGTTRSSPPAMRSSPTPRPRSATSATV